MELNSDLVTTPPRAAATLVMLRDTASGLEVFLQKRNGLSDVLGGAFVFPGGKVDALDAELDMGRHLDQPVAELHQRLNENGLDLVTAASLYVAVLREVYEEAGVLFAQEANSQQLERAQSLSEAGYGFNAMLGQLGLRLQARAMIPWSRWVTPKLPIVTNKRFDTRFFVATAPAGQIASHDGHETVASVWMSPRDALCRYWAGEIELAPPQIMSLSHLTHFGLVADVFSAARSRPPPVIAPEPFSHEGLRVICYPGDERHSVRERALPGPTRLSFRNKRFEPVGGLDALLGTPDANRDAAS